jgi:hypothetical protein
MLVDVSTANLLCGFQKLTLVEYQCDGVDASSPGALWLLLPDAGGLSELQGAPQGQHQSREMLRLIASYRALASPFSCGCCSSMSTLHTGCGNIACCCATLAGSEGHGDVRAEFAQRLS